MAGRLPRVPVEVRPVKGPRELKAFVDLPFRLHAGTPWVPPLKLERYVYLNRKLNPFFRTARPSTSSPGATGGSSGASPPRSTTPSTSSTTALGMFGFLEFEDDPEILDAMLSGGARLAARPRRGAHRRADGLRDERGKRHPVRGLRAGAADPAAVASAVLPAALRGGRADQGDGPVRLEARTSPTASSGAADPARARRALRDQARDPHPQDVAPAAAQGDRRVREVYNAAWSGNWGFVPYAKHDLDASRSTSSSSTTATGSWSPRTTRRPWRWRSRSPTSTRSARG